MNISIRQVGLDCWTKNTRAQWSCARLLRDLHDDPEEPIRIYADPAGHPFCIFVGA
ncbi:hypothetical protein [Rhodococcus sp. MALMAid1271]|uniref:hypothetical protein n=1 Tax=Rhodococcus sp. MALMAid1271 TaxID=3411744 RepID=UPI003B9EA343